MDEESPHKWDKQENRITHYPEGVRGMPSSDHSETVNYLAQ